MQKVIILIDIEEQELILNVENLQKKYDTLAEEYHELQEAMIYTDSELTDAEEELKNWRQQNARD